MPRNFMQLFFVTTCFVVSLSGMALGASIVGSKHDFSALNPNAGTSPFAGAFQTNGSDIVETCVFCHTPHSASSAGYLWNRTNPVSTGNYTLYTSSTLTMITLAQPTGLTLMCMSCHDGITSIAVNTLINAPYPATSPAQVTKIAGYKDTIGGVYNGTVLNNYQWGPNIGNAKSGTSADLSNDHPVSFTWVDGIPGIKTVNWSGTALKLFNNRMECSTCHDVHDPANPPFLRMSNANSDMCTTCHSK